MITGQWGRTGGGSQGEWGVGGVWEVGKGRGGRRWEFLKGSRGISGINAESFLIKKGFIREEAKKGGREPG